ncbi:MAG: AMP-binding protein [Acidimicrobiia bacterium]|nr:AMP-binding protein [Acidimicrobiia bacterium]
MAGRGSPSAPAPGEVAPPAPDAAALLRRNAADPDIAPRRAVLFGDRVWTHGEYVAESTRWANLFRSLAEPGRPLHAGVLLDNTPDYLFAFGGAALSGATVVGLNHTRHGEHLLRDLTHTDVGFLVTEPGHAGVVEPLLGDLPFAHDRVLVSRRHPREGDPEVSFGRDLDDVLAGVSADDPGVEPDPSSPWAFIFTSGTSSAPKAVICSQRRLLGTGARMGLILGIGPDDVGYVCMPLFHSNAVMVGWAPSIVHGAAVGLARRFSASGWLADVRRYGATWFNYTGKPLSYLVGTPEQPDDADNLLRIAFGNEGSPEVVETFARRFDVEVIDAFGATEGGIAVSRDVPDKPGSMGLRGENVRIVDEHGSRAAPRAVRRPGAIGESRRVCRRDRERRWRRAVRGLLQQSRGHRADDPERLVLEWRSRVSRRGPLPLLRRPQRRLDPRRRGELPGGSDRERGHGPSRRRRRYGVRRARRARR